MRFLHKNDSWVQEYIISNEIYKLKDLCTNNQLLIANVKRYVFGWVLKESNEEMSRKSARSEIQNPQCRRRLRQRSMSPKLRANA